MSLDELYNNYKCPLIKTCNDNFVFKSESVTELYYVSAKASMSIVWTCKQKGEKKWFSQNYFTGKY